MVKSNRPRIVVVAESKHAEVLLAARNLAVRLRMPFEDQTASQGLIEGTSDTSAWLLAMSDEGLELRDPATRAGRGLHVDFSDLHPQQARRRGGFSRTQPLARAIGRDTRIVLDATAGLGHDSALLACMGYDVLAVERSPIVAALLHDGLRRAMHDPELRLALGGRLQIWNADARDVLRENTWHVGAEAAAVYIDPMFPPKRKASALAKKSIRMVREIVGDDEDAVDLLDVACQHCKRVVVKRPTYAPPLANQPTASITGKLVRYDLYVE